MGSEEDLQTTESEAPAGSTDDIPPEAPEASEQPAPPEVEETTIDPPAPDESPGDEPEDEPEEEEQGLPPLPPTQPPAPDEDEGMMREEESDLNEQESAVVRALCGRPLGVDIASLMTGIGAPPDARPVVLKCLQSLREKGYARQKGAVLWEVTPRGMKAGNH